MIYSNDRKLSLSGWMQKNSQKEYETPLKLQKFLLFYEAFSKVAGEKPDFDHLRGYKRGPVFSNVWGDYTKERETFNYESIQAYENRKYVVNEEYAKKSAFIVSVLSENELSEFTHALNLWKSKEDRIMSGERQVDLDEKDFDIHDVGMIKTLGDMYPMDMIDNSSVIAIDNHFFIFDKKDITKLTEQHYDTLSAVAETGELHNPIYAEIDERGCLLID